MIRLHRNYGRAGGYLAVLLAGHRAVGARSVRRVAG